MVTPPIWFRHTLLAAALLLGCVPEIRAEGFLVKDGEPKAEIVIAEKPARMAKLAAMELQSYLEKVSGAKLPIVTAPTGGERVAILVGQSLYTERLKLTDDGLLHGAFRIFANASNLVLLGRDRDFSPREPWPRNARDNERVLQEWDQITGEKWGFDINLMQLYKQENKELGIWEQDERGSLNAVHEFLRSLGVRWYLPGELGEIVPKRTSIALPTIDRTVRPDFALRYAYQYGRRFSGKNEETMWQLRLGLNEAPDLIGPGYVAHGTNYVHLRPEVMRAHPEYYTLSNGKRDMADRGKPCLSSPGLLAQNVKYVRAMFDKMEVPVVSVMPADGYTGMCECPLCQGKETPERGGFGRFSDYTWGYVNAVAQEVLKTHPERKIICLAYGSSVLPPTKLAQLSPNIIVCIAQTRASFFEKEKREWMDELRSSWQTKLPAGSQQICVYDYYLHPRQERAFAFMPVYFPHAIAADLRALKGVSFGDYIEIYREGGLDAFGINALNVYVTTRLWWDSTLDVDALIDEYCRDLYGPAREEMKTFIAYSEAHWMEMSQSPKVITEAFALLAKAQQKIPAKSLPAQRLALVADYMQPLLARRDQMLRSAGREEARILRVNDRPGSEITLDGRLDEPLWTKLAAYQSGDLLDCTTQKMARAKSRIKLFWSNDSLYLGIRCDDPDVKNLTLTGTQKDDPQILAGDHLQFLIETQTHGFYQIAINPAGLVLDVDRQGAAEPAWSSGATIKTFIGEGFWSLEIRLPVMGDLQAGIDALNGISGRKPAGTYPWYFNLCRQRVRNGVIERSALSPTPQLDFLDPTKFARLNGYLPKGAAWEEEKKRRTEVKVPQ